MPKIRAMWEVKHYGADGRLLDAERGENLFHDEGEQSLMQLFSQEWSMPTNFYLGLDNRVGNAYAVSGVVTGSEYNAAFQVTGDITTECTAGEPLRINGSSGDKDGTYKIRSASYDSGSNTTTIGVREAISDATADGTLTLFAITEADTLADLVGEPDGTNNYSRKAVAVGNGFSTTQEGGDWKTETASQTITASGGSIGPVNTLFMATSGDNTGRLFQTKPLSREKTLNDEESLAVSLFLQLAE